MEEMLKQITEALLKLSDKHGEQAVPTLLETAQLMAMNDLIQTIITGLFGIFLILIAYTAKRPNDDFHEGIYFIRKITGYVVGTVFFMMAVSHIANPVLWKSLTDPKYYVTYKIMKKGLK